MVSKMSGCNLQYLYHKTKNYLLNVCSYLCKIKKCKTISMTIFTRFERFLFTIRVPLFWHGRRLSIGIPSSSCFFTTVLFFVQMMLITISALGKVYTFIRMGSMKPVNGRDWQKMSLINGYCEYSDYFDYIKGIKFCMSRRFAGSSKLYDTRNKAISNPVFIFPVNRIRC